MYIYHVIFISINYDLQNKLQGFDNLWGTNERTLFKKSQQKAI
jgi:hypothetical protein